jgi:hypothetical protein
MGSWVANIYTYNKKHKMADINNNEFKRMQELAGIKTDSKLTLLFKQIHQNNIKIDNSIKEFTNIIKERKNVSNRKS